MAAVLAMKPMEPRARGEPLLLDDQELVFRMSLEFEAWVIELVPEYFMHRLRALHKHFVLSRVGRLREPKEKWRYIVATWERALSNLRGFKRQQVAELAMQKANPEEGEASASERKIRKALDELRNFDRKMKLWRIAQQAEEGENELQGLPGSPAR